MATLSITQVGLRLSINLDCSDDEEARALHHQIVSGILDKGELTLISEARKPERQHPRIAE